MGEKTLIEWCDHTFNPWRGCSKIHSGCKQCYAEKLVTSRLGGHWGEVWQGGTREIAADSTWDQPFRWARAAARDGVRRRVFCSSLADVLETPEMPERWPVNWTEAQVHSRAQSVRSTRATLDAARECLWPIIEDTAWMCGGCGKPCIHSSDTSHRTVRILDLAEVGAACERKSGKCVSAPMGGLDFLLLTKRPENAPLVPEWVRPLVWLGTSISDQETADEWVPRLLAAEGFRYRFLSVEPLVASVDLTRLRDDEVGARWNALDMGISWVVVGGESGPKHRPVQVEWIADIVRQCQEAGVPVFVKQDSGPRAGMQGRIPDDLWRVKQCPGGAT